MTLCLLWQKTISTQSASALPTKAAADIVPHDLVYVEFDGGTWHLGRIHGRHSASELEVHFHDGDVATVDFTAEKHCMALEEGRYARMSTMRACSGDVLLTNPCCESDAMRMVCCVLFHRTSSPSAQPASPADETAHKRGDLRAQDCAGKLGQAPETGAEVSLCSSSSRWSRQLRHGCAHSLEPWPVLDRFSTADQHMRASCWGECMVQPFFH